jgi:hypothetical protein
MEDKVIRGMHAMFYSSEAAALREFLRDKLGLSGTDLPRDLRTIGYLGMAPWLMNS